MLEARFGRPGVDTGEEATAGGMRFIKFAFKFLFGLGFLLVLVGGGVGALAVGLQSASPFYSLFRNAVGERVAAAVTSSGTELPADLVVVGIGVMPNTALATMAGLEVDNGIMVDAALRTSDEAIYAAGDVAYAFHPLYGRRVRVEHWANALNGGPAAARSMLGQQVSYDRVPYFYSDQYELGMETFIAHNVLSPYRAVVLKEFQRYKVPLNMDVEMPTVETIRKMVQRNEGVAFLPRMCVEQDVEQDVLREVKVAELKVDRNIRLVYPARRSLSHAAKAFLELVKGG